MRTQESNALLRAELEAADASNITLRQGQASQIEALRAQAACINLCQKSKSDKVLLMLYESLCRWMLRKKQLIPRAILRQIQEQIQKFAKLKRIAIFNTVSLWAVHDKGCNLN